MNFPDRMNDYGVTSDAELEALHLDTPDDDGLIIPGVDSESRLMHDDFNPDYAVLSLLTDCLDDEPGDAELASPRLVEREQLPFDKNRDDMTATILNLVPYAVTKAKEVRKEADSYRVSVGAVLLASKTSKKGTCLYMYSGPNYKADQSVEKLCAELAVLERAMKDGCTMAEMFVVAGPSSEKTIHTITDVDAKTLHPCAQCRGMCHCSPLIRPDTKFMTFSNARGGCYQLQNFAEIETRYEHFEKTGQYHDPRLFRYRPTDWPVLVQKYLRDVRASGLQPLESVLDEPRAVVRRELALHVGRPLTRSLEPLLNAEKPAST
jgi:cytidine deaminase